MDWWIGGVSGYSFVLPGRSIRRRIVILDQCTNKS
jgi:hypothetical protein